MDTTTVSAAGSAYTSESKIRTLSKSDFKLARTCDAKLFFRENGYPQNTEYDPYLKFLAEAGYMAEALAKSKYPDGIQMEYGRDPLEDSRRTLEYLSRDSVTLFEATLLIGRRMARVDVLEKRGNVVRLIEVKAKSIDGDEHRALLDDGFKGVFWTKRKNPSIAEKWRTYLEDVTYQVCLLEQVLPNVTIKPVLALVDKSKRAAIDGIPSLFELEFEDRPDGTRRLITGHYIGDRELIPALDLITEIAINDEVASLKADVQQNADRLESLLDSALPVFLNGLPRTSECAKCEFRRVPDPRDGFADCWGKLSTADPHFLELTYVGSANAPDGERLIQWMWNEGKSALVDVPVEGLAKADGTIGPVAERQRRQIEYTKLGSPFISPSLRPKIEAIQWPAHFIDFETSRLALPSHKGMRPYGVVTFQWSCHTVGAPGARPGHSEWLNTADLWPNQTFAETLRAAIGDEGAVITWSPFENTTLKQVIADLAQFGRDEPELIEWMRSVEERIVDMHVWAREDYYHPRMGGRTSIKVVMDALWRTDPVMREQLTRWTELVVDEETDPYHALDQLTIDGVPRAVRDGTAAMRAYDAMMYGPGRRDAGIKDQWGRLLRQYCHLDTLSMVLILEHWRRAVGLA